MLSEKSWKAEAIARLGLSIFACQFLGATAVAVARFVPANMPRPPWNFWLAAAGGAVFSAAALFILRKPWDLQRLARSLMGSSFCLYLGLTCSALAQHFVGQPAAITTLRAIIAALSFHGAALLLLPHFLKEHHTGWGGAFGFAVDWKKALLYGALAACIFLPVGQALQIASAEILSRLRVEPEAQAAVQVLKNSATWLDRVALGAMAIGLAPVAEELLFRGILYPAVKQAGFPRIALWGTSLLFAAIHTNLAIFAPLLLLALVLTWLYEKTNNLLAPIAAHALFNALNFARFFFLENLTQSS